MERIGVLIMSKIMNWDWEYLFSVPGCHKWYRCRKTSRIAVADYSGQFPHETDGGVLWLIPNQKIAFRDEFWDGGTPIIRLENDNGEELLLGGTMRSEAIALVDNGLAKLSLEDSHVHHDRREHDFTYASRRPRWLK